MTGCAGTGVCAATHGCRSPHPPRRPSASPDRAQPGGWPARPRPSWTAVHRCLPTMALRPRTQRGQICRCARRETGIGQARCTREDEDGVLPGRETPKRGGATPEAAGRGGHRGSPSTRNAAAPTPPSRPPHPSSARPGPRCWPPTTACSQRARGELRTSNAGRRRDRHAPRTPLQPCSPGTGLTGRRGRRPAIGRRPPWSPHGVAGGVGTTTIARALAGVDRGVFTGRPVDVVVCRATAESLVRAGRAAYLITGPATSPPRHGGQHRRPAGPSRPSAARDPDSMAGRGMRNHTIRTVLVERPLPGNGHGGCGRAESDPPGRTPAGRPRSTSRVVGSVMVRVSPRVSGPVITTTTRPKARSPTRRPRTLTTAQLLHDDQHTAHDR